MATATVGARLFEWGGTRIASHANAAVTVTAPGSHAGPNRAVGERMTARLRAESTRLLQEVVAKRDANASPLVLAMQSRSLTMAERAVLCNILADELAETGLGANDEPNTRGLALDEVISMIWTAPHAPR